MASHWFVWNSSGWKRIRKTNNFSLRKWRMFISRWIQYNLDYRTLRIESKHEIFPEHYVSFRKKKGNYKMRHFVWKLNYDNERENESKSLFDRGERTKCDLNFLENKAHVKNMQWINESEISWWNWSEWECLEKNCPHNKYISRKWSEKIALA